MTASGRPAQSASAESLAAACRDADFVRLQATADGDALAALGQLAGALHATDTPFHANVKAIPDIAVTDGDLTVCLGADTDADITLTDEPLSAVAYAAADDIGVNANADAVLALAGAVAAGYAPGENTPLYEPATARLDRRPGIAVPVGGDTETLVDGLAHSTLVHADFSAARDTAATLIGALDTETLDSESHRRIASAVALRTIEDTPAHAAERVERLLRPYVGGPFTTVGGYADVLDACARRRPGLGVALAIDAARTDDDPTHAEEALDSWRDHATAAHTGLRTGEVARHSGLFVVRVEHDTESVSLLGTVARLAQAFRSPESLALAVDGERAALAGEHAGEHAQRVGEQTEAIATGRTTTGYIEGIDAETAETEVRRAV
ncbi:MAG: hypothetical protein U5K28_13020 [Halobacteriales archaeon]|nr:hypothetical protein [Halobacteriales archaeon]